MSDISKQLAERISGIIKKEHFVEDNQLHERSYFVSYNQADDYVRLHEDKGYEIKPNDDGIYFIESTRSMEDMSTEEVKEIEETLKSDTDTIEEEVIEENKEKVSKESKDALKELEDELWSISKKAQYALDDYEDADKISDEIKEKVKKLISDAANELKKVNEK